MHYAVLGDDGYETPAPLPGAVSISLEQQGEITPFYADGIVYYKSASNGGYEGDLEMALITDDFRKDVLGEEEDGKKVLIENINAQGKTFALGLQIDGDVKPTLFWFYNCTATRPNVESETTEDKKEPGTETVTISCASNEDGDVRAKTTGNTDDATRSSWFKSVYEKQPATQADGGTGQS